MSPSASKREAGRIEMTPRRSKEAGGSHRNDAACLESDRPFVSKARALPFERRPAFFEMTRSSFEKHWLSFRRKPGTFGNDAASFRYRRPIARKAQASISMRSSVISKADRKSVV